jgi:hypothetical protein
MRQWSRIWTMDGSVPRFTVRPSSERERPSREMLESDMAAVSRSMKCEMRIRGRK